MAHRWGDVAWAVMERKERAFRRWAQKDLPSDGCGSGGWKGESLVCLQGPWNPFSAQMACFPPPRMYTLDWHSHTQLISSFQAYLVCTALDAMETNEIWMAGLLSSLFFQDHCWLITVPMGQAAVRHCPLHLIWEGQAGSFICGTVKTSAVQQSSLSGPWLGTSR